MSTRARTAARRRPHTKSRNGCANCKRRHVRCDETFPHCRNCIGQKIHCNYKNKPSAIWDAQSNPESVAIAVLAKREEEDRLEATTGTPLSSTSYYLPPWQAYGIPDHDAFILSSLARISDDLALQKSTNFSIWTQYIPRFLDLSSNHLCVRYALLSFSVHYFSGSLQLTEAASLQMQMQYSGLAMRELRDSISEFSTTNADAILTASLLMSWQARNWRDWSLLRAGLQVVLATIQSRNYFSSFFECTKSSHATPDFDTPSRQTLEASIVPRTIQALQGLHMALHDHELEARYTGRLIGLVRQLRDRQPSSNGELPFSRVYELRQFLFWTPISLLRQLGGKHSALFALQHFYSTTLALEPLFTEWGSVLCGAMVFPSLEAVRRRLESMYTEMTTQDSAPTWSPNSSVPTRVF